MIARIRRLKAGVGRLVHHPIETTREWWAEPIETTRGPSLAWRLLFAGACFGALFGTDKALDRIEAIVAQRAVDQCVARVDGRDEVRGALAVIVNLVDEADGPGVDPIIVEARARLDVAYPPLELDNCLGDISP